MLRQYVKYSALTLLLVFLIWFYLLLPKPLVKSNYSTVLLDNQKQLLGATLANDQQWRFATPQTLPNKYQKALLMFEDRRFFAHPGVSVPALARALWANLKAGKVVQGGSTITMQLARIAQGNPKRTLWQKAFEIVLAMRIELSYSKKNIIELYATHAPFGGNIVGIEAAAYKYFNRPPNDLSWAEAALLAVLPNAPALIHPGKNQKTLQKKRNRLLTKLFDNKIIPQIDYQLAIDEPMPSQVFSFEQLAPLLLYRARHENPNQATIQTTLNSKIQKQTKEIVDRHSQALFANQIYNAAVLVANINTGKVLAYVGNIGNCPLNQKGTQIDMIKANRSTGSLLKPFLYACLLKDGYITPRGYIKDVPIRIGNYVPESYSGRYLGLVNANSALTQSLNVPWVILLRQYGYPIFYDKLKAMGLTDLNKPASYYGLSLILGGSESSLWQITGLYASMARTLTLPNQNKTCFGLSYLQQENTNSTEWPLAEAEVFETLQTLKSLERPGDELHWERFAANKTIAWKTGTSHGNKDAWSIGLNGKYAVGVWVGNASGRGRNGLWGITKAAPIMFEVFNLLPHTPNWIKTTPNAQLTLLKICKATQLKAGKHCPTVEQQLVPTGCQQTKTCPYHTTIFINPTTKKRAHRQCSNHLVAKTSWQLDPIAEKFYKKTNPNYAPMPPWDANCLPTDDNSRVAIIYPTHNIEIIETKDYDGQAKPIIAEAAQNANGAVFWYLNNHYLGQTASPHQIKINPKSGVNYLTTSNNHGSSHTIKFTVKKSSEKTEPLE